MVSERVAARGRGWLKVLGPCEEGGGIRMFSREGPHENTAGEGRLPEEEGPMRYSERQRRHKGFKMGTVVIFNFNPLAMLWHGVMSPLSSLITAFLCWWLLWGVERKELVFPVWEGVGQREETGGGRGVVNEMMSVMETR